MDSPRITRTRRRTNSFAAPEMVAPIIEVQPTVPPIVETESITPKSTRFRRSSFALSGERQTTLDDLVDSASQHVASIAAHREAANISSLIPAPVEILQAQTAISESNLPRDDVCHVPTSTFLPKSVQLPCSTESHHDMNTKQRSIVPSDSRHPFVWHNTEAFPSNPLTSELVLKYLAAVAVDQNSGSTSPRGVHSPGESLALSENIPGLLSLSSHSVASMTMPVRQIYWAHKVGASSKLSSSHDPISQFALNKSAVAHDRATFLSDSESWHGRGCISDSPPVFESKRLRSANRKVESDFQTHSSLPRSSKKQRPNLLPADKHAEHLTKYDSVPSTHLSIHSKFDVNRVYEGLSLPDARESKISRSTASLNYDLPQRCLTPPSTPNSLDSRSSTSHSLSSSHGLHRLRSLFSHLKTQLSDDNSETYIYLDEETRSKRAKAQASNVISPVSF